ncbi:unnamed protein product, partial [Phaeothamnion confervicola]
PAKKCLPVSPPSSSLPLSPSRRLLLSRTGERKLRNFLAPSSSSFDPKEPICLILPCPSFRCRSCRAVATVATLRGGSRGKAGATPCKAGKTAA